MWRRTERRGSSIEITEQAEISRALETAKAHPEDPAARFLVLMARVSDIMAEAGGEGSHG